MLPAIGKQNYSTLSNALQNIGVRISVAKKCKLFTWWPRMRSQDPENVANSDIAALARSSESN